MSEVIGLLAGICTTISTLPQVIKTWQEKETKNLSLPTFLFLFTGVYLWAVYGLLTSDWLLLSFNAIGFFLLSIIVFFKLKYG